MFASLTAGKCNNKLERLNVHMYKNVIHKNLNTTVEIKLPSLKL